MTLERNNIRNIRFLVKVRRAFRGKRKRDLLTFLVFIVLASFFWFINLLKEPIETEVLVPFRIVNVPRDIIVTSEIPKQIRVKIRDKGSVVLSYKYRDEITPCVINYADLKTTKGYCVIQSDRIAEQLSDIFPASSQLLSYTPDVVALTVSRGESKVVPVYLLKSIQTVSSYGVNGPIRMSANSVTLYAPVDRLSEIDAVYTTPLIVKSGKDTISTKVALEKIEGVRMVPSEIGVTVPIESFTEKRIEVAIEGENLPLGFAMRFFPAKATLICYVALSDYNRVVADDFKFVVDFKLVSQHDATKFPIRLVKWPSYVSKIRFQPADTEVLIEEEAQ